MQCGVVSDGEDPHAQGYQCQCRIYFNIVESTGANHQIHLSALIGIFKEGPIDFYLVDKSCLRIGWGHLLSRFTPFTIIPRRNLQEVKEKILEKGDKTPLQIFRISLKICIAISNFCFSPT